MSHSLPQFSLVGCGRSEETQLPGGTGYRTPGGEAALGKGMAPCQPHPLAGPCPTYPV